MLIARLCRRYPCTVMHWAAACKCASLHLPSHCCEAALDTALPAGNPKRHVCISSNVHLCPRVWPAECWSNPRAAGHLEAQLAGVYGRRLPAGRLPAAGRVPGEQLRRRGARRPARSPPLQCAAHCVADAPIARERALLQVATGFAGGASVWFFPLSACTGGSSPGSFE